MRTLYGLSQEVRNGSAGWLVQPCCSDWGWAGQPPSLPLLLVGGLQACLCEPPPGALAVGVASGHGTAFPRVRRQEKGRKGEATTSFCDRDSYDCCVSPISVAVIDYSSAGNL